jgi:hypothetical protein
MDAPIASPAGSALRSAIAASGNTPLGFARKVGIPPLVLSKRLNNVTADGTGRLSDADEAAIAAGLVT